MSDLSLLVLAAGLGRRYQGLKQVDPVGPSGATMLDYSLYGALKAGFNRVVFVIRREIEGVFRQAVGDHWRDRFQVEYVFQEVKGELPEAFAQAEARKKPWGTGQAVLVSRATIASPFATINSDDFYGRDAFRDLAAWLKDHPSRPGTGDVYCFVGHRLRNTLSEHGYVSRGVCRIDREGYLAEVVERVRIEKDGAGARTLDDSGTWLPLTGDEVVSMNCWGFQPSIFGHLEDGFIEFLKKSGGDPQAEFYIPSVVNDLIRAGKARVKYLPTEDPWFGITYPEDLPLVRAHVRELIRAGIYPENVRTERPRT